MAERDRLRSRLFSGGCGTLLFPMSLEHVQAFRETVRFLSVIPVFWAEADIESGA